MCSRCCRHRAGCRSRACRASISVAPRRSDVIGNANFELNANVVVSLIGLHAAAGVVKWRDGDYYGIGFNRVYPVHELMAFLKEQQREESSRRAVA